MNRLNLIITEQSLHEWLLFHAGVGSAMKRVDVGFVSVCFF